MTRTAVLLISFFVGMATKTTAEMIKSEVKMNLEEFQDIFSAARLSEAEHRVVEQKKRHEAEHQRKIKELDNAIRQSKVNVEKDRLADHLALFPDNYKVLTQRADGIFNSSAPAAGVEGDVASFDIELMIRVMSSKWTTIPIANTTSIVASDWRVSWMPERDDTNNSPTGSAYVVLDPVADPEAMLLIKDEQQVLATNKPGLFQVQFSAHSRVRKDRKLNSVSLSSLLYPLSGASMTLCSHDMSAPDIDEGIAVKELSIHPTSAVLKVQPDDGCARISVILPLTSTKFEIRWLDIVEAAKEKKKVDPGAIDEATGKDPSDELLTVSHDVMHSVEDGVVRSTNVLKFETSESGLNSVEFVVHGPKGTRVTSVSGYSLSRWNAGAYNATTSSIPVRALFKSSNLDSSVTLHVHTESDTDAAAKTQTLELPRIECVGALRHSGHIGVIKVANGVELHQQRAVGLARAEPTDISSQLRLNTDRPIMLAYKYLNPKYTLHLSSTSHTAMDTLEAVVDRVHYEALAMDTHIMHSLVVMMKSTKLQYLEIQNIPPETSMFTLIVNGVQTKPVRGGKTDDSLLVPLLVGLNTETANDGLGVKTSIELRYFSTHDPLDEEGYLDLPLPRVTVPISIVTAELRLPKIYSYNFTGDFGSRGSDRLKYPVPSAFSYVKGKRIVPKDYKFSRLDDDVLDDEPSQNEGGGSAIQMDIPQSGRSYFFERLLVVNTPLSLNVAYFPHPEPKEPPAISIWDKLKFQMGL
eukprot:CAMPEP_0196141116 /NCGR_PEP_ID=MMETSP0910-20130528/8782_1 /TAXON_ID=49265 /ORGANISM="Thalassiosira rotula, Strain GSO102" /LENGTH=751 /DNA_ID=CAMNT_0041402161 /DNA_START=75 /DNA_END=2330 /DNA_ORIENTATION=-